MNVCKQTVQTRAIKDLQSDKTYGSKRKTRFNTNRRKGIDLNYCKRKLVHKEAESGPVGTSPSDVRVSSEVAAIPVLPVTRNRTDTSDSKPSSKNVLVLGDSMIRHAIPSTLSEEVILECRPGARITDLKEVLLSYVNHRFSVIHIHVGTNNLRRGYRGGPGYNGGHGKREALHDMADLLFTTKKNFPNSKVFVNSIIIRSDISYKALHDFNVQLDLMCNNFGVMFVEANCWVSRRHLARDGRHLNREGVSRLSSLFGALIPASLRVMEDSVASVSQEIVVSPLRVCPDPVSLPLLEESSGSGYAPESGNEQIEACVLRT
ncbi:hypothetical protein J6590_056064 [Homalodisca vitripennis]|nr:hypothetical protein J6590_056064 [Homalodisca vitripennis]